MFNWELIFWVVFALFAVQFLSAFILSNRVRRDEKPGLPRISRVTVVIPFHNEEKRINGLLESLNSQAEWPSEAELIFVDDFSSDHTADIIREKLKKPHRIITLQKKSGKKNAIHEGVTVGRHDYILTLDADVKLGRNYFATLRHLPQTDMIILPVTMTGKTLVAKLASIEFSWLQLLTYGANKPVLSNGANLLFRKSAYHECYAGRKDLHLASGDDIFLMQAFMNSGKDVHRFLDDDLAVTTPAHEHLASLLQQRRRWMSKFAQMANASSIALTCFLVLLQIGLIISLIGIMWYPWFALLFALKFFSEFIAAVIYRHTGYRGIFFVTLLHQFWYPVYMILLLLPRGKEEKWET